MLQSVLGQGIHGQEMPYWDISHNHNHLPVLLWIFTCILYTSHEEVGKSSCRAGRCTLPHNRVQKIFSFCHSNRMHKCNDSGVNLSLKTSWGDVWQYSMPWQNITCWQLSPLSAELLVSLCLLIQTPWERRDRQMGMVTSYTFALGVHKVQLTVP